MNCPLEHVVVSLLLSAFAPFWGLRPPSRRISARGQGARKSMAVPEWSWHSSASANPSAHFLPAQGAGALPEGCRSGSRVPGASGLPCGPAAHASTAQSLIHRWGWGQQFIGMSMAGTQLQASLSPSARFYFKICFLLHCGTSHGQG